MDDIRPGETNGDWVRRKYAEKYGVAAQREIDREAMARFWMQVASFELAWAKFNVIMTDNGILASTYE